MYNESPKWYEKVFQSKVGRILRLRVAKKLVRPFIPVRKGLNRFYKIFRDEIKHILKGKERNKLLGLERLRVQLERQGLDYKAILKKAYKYQEFFTPENLIAQNRMGRLNWAYRALGGKKLERLFNLKRWGIRLKGDPGDLNFLIGGGYAGQYANPTLALKYYEAGEKLGYWTALKQKTFKLYVNTMLYHEMCENMRRLLCFDTLLTDKAMSIAMASAKTRRWMYDYSDVGAAGRLLRKFFPFFSFTSQAVKLYTKELLEQGPRVYFASKAVIEAWNKVTEDFPDWAKDMVPIPGLGIAFRPNLSLLDISKFIVEPRKSLERSLNNPLNLPFGLSWNPLISLFLEKATEMKYFDHPEVLRRSNWTEKEIQDLLKKQSELRKFNWSQNVWSTLTMFFPDLNIASVFVPMLWEIDSALLDRELGLLNSKTIRNFLKTFGVNIRRIEPWSKLAEEYFRVPPRLRNIIGRRLKEENPENWKRFQDQLFATKIYHLTNAKTKKERDYYLERLLEAYYISRYYELEEHHSGDGDRWLEKEKQRGNLIPATFLRNYWKSDSVWHRIQQTRIERAKQAKIIRTWIKKEIPAKVTAKQVAIAHGPFGINEYPLKPITREDVERQFFDVAGNLKLDSFEQAELKAKEISEEFGIKDLSREHIKEAERNELEYRLMSFEAKEMKRLADALYYQKWKEAWSLIPKNIDSLSKERQQRYWNRFNEYIEDNFTLAEKRRWKESQPEYIKRYQKKMNNYIQAVKKTIEIAKNPPTKEWNWYIEGFDMLTPTQKEVYFINNPKMRDKIPFLRKRIKLMREDRKKHLLGLESNLAEKFTWSEDLIARRGRLTWDKKEHDFQKRMRDLIRQSEKNLKESGFSNFYELWNSQPNEFKKYTFARIAKFDPEEARNLKRFYDFAIEFEKKRIKDMEARKKGKKSFEAEEFFKLPENQKIIDWREKSDEMYKGFRAYYTLLFELAHKPETNFYLELDKNPEAKTYFLRHHLGYVKFFDLLVKFNELRREDEKKNREEGIRSFSAFEYFFDPKNTEMRQALELKKPGTLFYYKTLWSILEKSKEPGDFERLILENKIFKTQYLERHPLAKYYLEPFYKLQLAIKLDQKNAEKGVYSNFADKYFMSSEFQKALEIKDKEDPGYKLYRMGWFEINQRVKKAGNSKFGQILKEYIKTHKDWYQEAFKREPLKFKVLFPFKEKLFSLKPNQAESFYWNSKNELARRLLNKEDPLAEGYYRFWRELSRMAEAGHWNRYFKYYYSKENKVYRLKHYRSDYRNKERWVLWKKYQLMPSRSWENRKVRRKFLKDHQALVEWFQEDLPESQKKIHQIMNDYYNIIDAIPDKGKDLDYFKTWRKQMLQAEKFKEENPELLEYWQNHPKQYGLKEKLLFDHLEEYNSLIFQYLKQKYIQDHPDVREYLELQAPPGIRDVRKLQEKYFKIDEKNYEKRKRFIEKHPSLQYYWEALHLPTSYWFNKTKFKKYENAFNETKDYFKQWLTKEWSSTERIRRSLPGIYFDPGKNEEANWLKWKIYSEAMKTFSSLAAKAPEDKIPIRAITFFRQLPDWVRDIYYERHPEKMYLSKYRIRRFIEEGMRIEAKKKFTPRTLHAVRLQARYAPNIPSEIKEQIRREYIKAGIWKTRAYWTREHWERYWRNAAIQRSDASERDFRSHPLLFFEMNKSVKYFTLHPNRHPFKKRPLAGKIVFSV